MLITHISAFFQGNFSGSWHQLTLTTTCFKTCMMVDVFIITGKLSLFAMNSFDIYVAITLFHCNKYVITPWPDQHPFYANLSTLGIRVFLIHFFCWAYLGIKQSCGACTKGHPNNLLIFKKCSQLWNTFETLLSIFLCWSWQTNLNHKYKDYGHDYFIYLFETFISALPEAQVGF